MLMSSFFVDRLMIAQRRTYADPDSLRVLTRTRGYVFSSNPDSFEEYLRSSCLSAVLLQIKTLRLSILSNVARDSYVQQSGGHKRKWYFLLYVAITQPLLSYWLTTHVAAS